MARDITRIGGSFGITSTTQIYHRPSEFTTGFAGGVFSVFDNSANANGQAFVDAGTAKGIVINMYVTGGGTRCDFSCWKSGIVIPASVVGIAVTGTVEHIFDEPVAEGDYIHTGAVGVGAISGTWRYRLGLIAEYT